MDLCSLKFNFYKIELSKSFSAFVCIKDDLNACAKISTSSSVSLDNSFFLTSNIHHFVIANLSHWLLKTFPSSLPSFLSSEDKLILSFSSNKTLSSFRFFLSFVRIWFSTWSISKVESIFSICLIVWSLFFKTIAARYLNKCSLVYSYCYFSTWGFGRIDTSINCWTLLILTSI